MMPNCQTATGQSAAWECIRCHAMQSHVVNLAAGCTIVYTIRYNASSVGIVRGGDAYVDWLDFLMLSSNLPCACVCVTDSIQQRVSIVVTTSTLHSYLGEWPSLNFLRRQGFSHFHSLISLSFSHFLSDAGFSAAWSCKWQFWFFAA